jgi:hypothetical protein
VLLAVAAGVVAQAAQVSLRAAFRGLHPVVHPLLQDMLGFVPPEPPKDRARHRQRMDRRARPDRMTPGHPRHREAT